MELILARVGAPRPSQATSPVGLVPAVLSRRLLIERGQSTGSCRDPKQTETGIRTETAALKQLLENERGKHCNAECI